MLRPFEHPVACCWMLLRVVAQSLKPVILLAPCKRTQHCWLTTPNIVGSCCVRLHVALDEQRKARGGQEFAWSARHARENIREDTRVARKLGSNVEFQDGGRQACWVFSTAFRVFPRFVAIVCFNF